MSHFAFVIFCAASIFTLDAKAEWVQAKYTYNFGPEMSQREACQIAERRAKEKAHKSIVGEKISSEDYMVCSEMKGAADCSLNRFTWSTMAGYIQGTKNKQETLGNGIGKYRQCTVTLDVNIGVAEGSPDPSFDLQVKLNRRTLRDGESLKLDLNPTQTMYINVFQWQPYMDAEKQVSRIFPNAFDKRQLFRRAGTVPTHEGSQQYEMTVVFPEGVKKSKRLVDEHLMVLGTKNPIKFLGAYSLEDFHTRLLEIPRQDKRIVRRAYNVVRQR
jgi:hypothetical protein